MLKQNPLPFNSITQVEDHASYMLMWPHDHPPMSSTLLPQVPLHAPKLLDRPTKQHNLFFSLLGILSTQHDFFLIHS